MAFTSCSLPNLNPIDISDTATNRTDLYYGYYGTLGSQARDTADHVNLVLDHSWDGEDATFQRMREYKIPTLLGVERFLFDANGMYKASAPLEFDSFIGRLISVGVFNSVLGFYPVDEPDLKNISSESMIEANVMIRTILQKYSQKSYILAVIYSNPAGSLPGLGSFNWVGFDDYGNGDKIFTNGEYARFRNRVGSMQSLILVPGGADPWTVTICWYFLLKRMLRHLQLICLLRRRY